MNHKYIVATLVLCNRSYWILIRALFRVVRGSISIRGKPEPITRN